MWESLKQLPQGRLSLRNFSLFVTNLLVASFVYGAITTQTVYADDATHQGNDLSYDGKTFSKSDDITEGDMRGLPAGTRVFEHQNPNGKREYIFVTADKDLSQATTGTYVIYDFTPPANFSNPSPPQTITIAEPTPVQTPGAGPETSCSTDITKGMGWIICPTVNFLASGMDRIFAILSEFLSVRPVQTSTDNPLYKLWVISRDFANIAFIIGFLFIVYSQLTSLGLSSYGIKRTLPRLIIAAILVNLSYWISALAVDISNSLGYAIHDAFIDVFKSMNGEENYNDMDLWTWESIAGAILSGGGAVGALAAYSHLFIAASVGGALFMLIPMLLGLLMAILVALLVLAARQAIITALIVVSPLAFVAYMLPNTEKYFEKWRSLFMTMLLMFPIFGAIFGASQLAGMAIIQSADSLNLILLGMAVQIAPIVVTPLLIKFSGKLLASIANIVNNPKKGALDRTRNWAQERSEQHKARVLAGKGRNNWANRKTRKIDHNRRKNKAWQTRNEAISENLFSNSHDGKKLFEADQENEMEKKRIHAQHQGHWNNKVLGSPTLLDRAMQTHLAEDRAKLSELKVENVYNELKAGHSPASLRQSTLSRDASDIAQHIAIEGIRKNQAEQVEDSALNKALLENVKVVDGQRILKYATGVGDGDLALARVVAKSRKDFGEEIDAQTELMRHFKLNADDIIQISMGRGDVIKRDSNGNQHTFKTLNEPTREAALEEAFKVGSHNQKMDIIKSTGALKDANGDPIAGATGVNYDYRLTIQQAAIKSGIGTVAPAINDKTLNDIINGDFIGDRSWKKHTIRQVLEGRLKIDSLARANQDSLRLFFDITKPGDTDFEAELQALNPEQLETFTKNYEAMKNMVVQGLQNSTIRRETNSDSIKLMLDFVKDRYREDDQGRPVRSRNDTGDNPSAPDTPNSSSDNPSAPDDPVGGQEQP